MRNQFKSGMDISALVNSGVKYKTITKCSIQKSKEINDVITNIVIDESISSVEIRANYLNEHEAMNCRFTGIIGKPYIIGMTIDELTDKIKALIKNDLEAILCDNHIVGESNVEHLELVNKLLSKINGTYTPDEEKEQKTLIDKTLCDVVRDICDCIKTDIPLSITFDGVKFVSVQPTNLNEIANTLQHTKGNFDNFTNHTYHYVESINVQDLINNEFEKVGLSIIDLLNDYKNSIYYLWDIHKNDNKYLIAKGDVAQTMIDGIPFFFDKSSAYQMIPNVYSQNLEFEDKRTIKETINNLLSDLDGIEEIGFRDEDRKKIIDSTKGWIKELLKYTEGNYYNVTLKESYLYCVIDEQGNIIKTQEKQIN
jgi:hypothetical protein